jgi:hypothetical protein
MARKYNTENLVKILRNPEKMSTAMNLIIQDIKKAATNNLEEYYYSERYKHNEADILNKDWDNLIILDACRYDVLQSIYPKEIEKIISNAGNSSEFIEKSMNGKELYDMVYISSNPHTDMTLNDGVFHEVIKTYSGTWEKRQSNDHTKYHPENVYTIAKQNIEKYPNKKIIVHFMQPHGPYFGDTANKLREQLIKNENISFSRLNDTSSDVNEHYPDLMWAARNGGYLSPELVREVYTENLKLVLQYAEKLSEQIHGKTVISADHGERLGNPSIHFTDKYGHGGYAPEVRTIPWLELGYERRKEIIAEDPLESEDVDEKVVTEQLEDLGYL